MTVEESRGTIGSAGSRSSGISNGALLRSSTTVCWQTPEAAPNRARSAAHGIAGLFLSPEHDIDALVTRPALEIRQSDQVSAAPPPFGRILLALWISPFRPSSTRCARPASHSSPAT